MEKVCQSGQSGKRRWESRDGDYPCGFMAGEMKEFKVVGTATVYTQTATVYPKV